ncbi:MAG: acyl-CoA dehydrogenase family protein [Bacteroidota bacterium]
MYTHEVFNQSPVIDQLNLYSIDPILKYIAEKQDISWAEGLLSAYGEKLGQQEWIRRGKQANQYIPQFFPTNEKGFRVDEIVFHPAYHDLMAIATEYQVHSLPYTTERPHAHIVRFLLNFLDNQNEAGTNCPLTMTFAAVPPLQKYFVQAEEWIPKILNSVYDPANKPYFEKEGLTIGMAMTEKQGGSDVRANTTQAQLEDSNGDGEIYALTGHKWFCSAPMCDAFLTLAQTETGLSCFLMPRWKPDGTKNTFRIQRLKDKLGNKSNASSELEMDKAFAWLLGPAGRGVATIIEMVALTRYDCMIGSSSLMRRGLTEVLQHIKHRSVFGKKLIDQPLMRNVVADLCLELEAAVFMTYRAAQCLDEASEKAQQLLRIITPIGKYWITKRAIPFLGEAMECLGGNGYIEDNILPRLYREAPVNAIWEGSGNVQCLDLMRVLKKNPQLFQVLQADLQASKGMVERYDRYVDAFLKNMDQYTSSEFYARTFMTQLALWVQASMMIRFGSLEKASLFCESRLSQHSSYQFGMLRNEPVVDQILAEYMF